MRPEFVVVGAGTVGAAIAYGFALRGARVLLLDGDDGDFRAARANFGLVWLQGKGLGMPAYQTLTRQSIGCWQGFADELETRSDMALCYEQNGGPALCLRAHAFQERPSALPRLHNHWGRGEAALGVGDRSALEQLLPEVAL